MRTCLKFFIFFITFSSFGSEIRFYHDDQFIGQISCLDSYCEEVAIYAFRKGQQRLVRLGTVSFQNLLENLEKVKYRPALREFSYHFNTGPMFQKNLALHRRILEGLALVIDLGTDIYHVPKEYQMKRDVHQNLKESLLNFRDEKLTNHRIIEFQVESKVEANVVISFLGVLSGKYSYAFCNQLMLKKLLKYSSEI